MTVKEDGCEKLKNEIVSNINHLEKIKEMVDEDKKRFRPPYHKKTLSVSENLKLVSRNLDKLSKQVQ